MQPANDDDEDDEEAEDMEAFEQKMDMIDKVCLSVPLSVSLSVS